MKIIILYITIIILKAITDGQNDTGHKGIGHTLTSLWIALLIVTPNFLTLPIWYVQIIAFTLLMIALFDFAYNITRGLPLRFIGTTSWWDKAIAKVPFGYMCLVRGIALIVGIFLIINE